jgi:hypothetical protein
MLAEIVDKLGIAYRIRGLTSPVLWKTCEQKRVFSTTLMGARFSPQ